MKLSFRLFPYLLLISTLVIVYPLLGGCAGPDKSNRFIQLLRLIPAQLTELTDSPEPLLLSDLASYLEDYNISLIDSEGNPITVEEYVNL